MPPGPSPGSSSTGLTITNPLVLYRSLLATKCISPDPAQHRLALHLQKLYHRLKDYEPAVDYKYQLDQLANSVELTRPAHPAVQYHGAQGQGRRMGILSSFREHKERAEALALTRKLTDQESAVQLKSPQGLLLHGDVGTGKSMLVDLLADCLPNRKKRRRHFNTFMLENFAKLEQLRRSRLGIAVNQDEEHSLLWLARDMISTSPILFLDEFQLPDRVSSKILSSLLTSFFNLGGVLIATSNRMPEQLANASGVEFAIPPVSRLGMPRHRWSLLGPGSHGEESETVSPGKRDFAAFLDVLRARCQIWDMEGGKDWRRQEAVDVVPAMSAADEEDGSPAKEQGFHGLQPMLPGNWGLGYEQSVGTSQHEQTMVTKGDSRLPKYYFTHPVDAAATRTKGSQHAWDAALRHAVADNHPSSGPTAAIPWKPASLRVYGRDLFIPRRLGGVSLWTFGELCVTRLGPADYITLASNFHTFVVTDVPVLTLLDKNEARRLITLLDALYECRCRLLVRAAAGPDDIFFPESQSWSSSTAPEKDTDDAEPSDGVYPETFSEIFQDQTSPFRPNVSAYTSSASPPSYDSSPLPSSASPSAKATRSILADEDSDFGPTYGAGRSPGSRYRGPADGIPGAGNEIGQQPSPDFSRTGVFTGEDERFAYKRATSRLWEMCGTRWWTKEEGWWKPLEKEVRGWENSIVTNSQRDAAVANTCASAEPDAQHSEGGALFRHGASPFRTSQDPPPKIPWTHAWGMVKWGKKAGAWGQGIEGLDKRKAGSGHEGNTP
ncbi:MAG: hypothetical protein Q9208_002159 [Pyrenodesmia sp. 3 TL-2023]